MPAQTSLSLHAEGEVWHLQHRQGCAAKTECALSVHADLTECTDATLPMPHTQAWEHIHIAILTSVPSGV